MPRAAPVHRYPLPASLQRLAAVPVGWATIAPGLARRESASLMLKVWSGAHPVEDWEHLSEQARMVNVVLSALALVV